MFIRRSNNLSRILGKRRVMTEDAKMHPPDETYMPENVQKDSHHAILASKRSCPQAAAKFLLGARMKAKADEC
jgi:hypothetical protein